MREIPSPVASWRLLSSSSWHGGSPLELGGTGCNFTSDGLVLASTCMASAAHSPALRFGTTASFTICGHFQSRIAGATLLAKFGPTAPTTPPAARASSISFSTSTFRGFAISLADTGHGLGIDLQDGLGVSTHEELGRATLADGAWHHICVVFQRAAYLPQLVVYVDGTVSETLALRGSRLRHLASVDNAAPLLLGRRSGHRTSPAGLRDVAIWTRALLPEHVAAVFHRGLPAPRTRTRHRPADGAGTFRMRQHPVAEQELPRGTEGHQLAWWSATGLLLAPMGIAGCVLRRRSMQSLGGGVGRWVARALC